MKIKTNKTTDSKQLRGGWVSFSSQVIAVTEENQDRNSSYTVKEKNLEEQCSLACSWTLKKPRTTCPGKDVCVAQMQREDVRSEFCDA